MADDNAFDPAFLDRLSAEDLTDRAVALLVAAMLPGQGRETAYLLGSEPEVEGYPSRPSGASGGWRPSGG